VQRIAEYFDFSVFWTRSIVYSCFCSRASADHSLFSCCPAHETGTGDPHSFEIEQEFYDSYVHSAKGPSIAQEEGMRNWSAAFNAWSTRHVTGVDWDSS